MTTGGGEKIASLKTGGKSAEGGAKFCDGTVLAIILSKLGGEEKGGGTVCSFDTAGVDRKSNEGGVINVAG